MLKIMFLYKEFIFLKSANETSADARLALVSCTVEYILLCVANPKESENGEHSQTPNCQPNSRNSCSRIVLVMGEGPSRNSSGEGVISKHETSIAGTCRM